MGGECDNPETQVKDNLIKNIEEDQDQETRKAQCVALEGFRSRLRKEGPFCIYFLGGKLYDYEVLFRVASRVDYQRN